MLLPDITRNNTDLQQILELQQRNLKQNITQAEKNDQGFLTLQHTLPILQQFHELAPSIVIRDNDNVVAYALTELRECRLLMPALEPMFALLDRLEWMNKPVNSYRFYTMGQICIAKEYRGQGLFDQLYQYHKKIYQSRFDLFITEIASSNHRSIRAHKRAGFVPFHTHRDELDEWLMVLWDWRE